MGPGTAPETVTDATGAFELRGVRAGSMAIVARHPSFAEGRTTADIDPAKDTPDVRIVLAQGGRIEGRARRRDGTAIPGMVILMPAATGIALSMDNTVQISPEGTFTADHVPAGRVRVVLMTGSAGTFSNSQEREVDVREGEAAAVEFVSRDVLVSGRVTRAGIPLPNLRLRLEGTTGFTAIISMGGGAAAPPAAGPQPRSATTREDGTYALIADQPGKASLRLESPDGALGLPPRSVEIPDADTFAYDVDLPAAGIAGFVYDRDTDQPVARASVYATATKPVGEAGGPMAGIATTGADGRFRLDTEPGEYRLEVRAEGYRADPVTVAAGAEGTTDVRIALERGLSIRGRVVDARGQGVGGLAVFATRDDAARSFSSPSDMTLPDGTFEVRSLAAGAYALGTRSDLGGFAIRTGVAAGSEDVRLTLRPGGRVAVSVVGPDGAPVAGAFVFVSRVGGTAISGVSGFAQTDSAGRAEIQVPAGALELRSSRERLEGTATVTVSEGQTAPALIRLAPRPSAPTMH